MTTDSRQKTILTPISNPLLPEEIRIMKKTVLTFGLIGGAVIAALTLVTLPFSHKLGFDKALVVGYTVMVLSFLMVFFGIRSYRDNIGGGTISFGRAFAVGSLIVLVISVCYVVNWEIMYFKFMPNFVSDYSNYMVEKLRAAGATQQAIDAKLQEMKELKQLLDNPLKNAAMSFIEPLPVGLIMTLISSLILKKKGKGPSPSNEPAQQMAA
jgi:hypothetical protein